MENRSSLGLFVWKDGAVRADRLVAVLLMLQARGRVTASEVAQELEVSERTARRDLEALGVAGLPIYSVQGRNGGWELLGGGRTDLSGLTAAETRALFLVAGSQAATPRVKAALRKLMRAIPETFREQAAVASGAVLVDPTGWDQRPLSTPSPPLLDAVQEALVCAQQVSLGYVARGGDATTRVVHPLGLAAKGRHWYLVAGTDAGLRTFRVDRMTSVEPTGHQVERPDGFDMRESWGLITDEIEERRTPVTAAAFVTADAVGYLRFTLGRRIRIGPATADGRIEVEIRGHSVRSLAAEIGGFGGAVEVLEPEELRDELARIGAELTACYRVPPSRRTQ